MVRVREAESHIAQMASASKQQALFHAKARKCAQFAQPVLGPEKASGLASILHAKRLNIHSPPALCYMYCFILCAAICAV